MKFMVATPLIAVAVLAIVLAWGHSFSTQTSAVNAQMDLTVKTGTIPCGVANPTADFCVSKGEQFTLSADLVKAPAAGYIGIQTEVVYGALVYKPTATADPETTWPDGTFALRSPGAPSGLEGQVNHADTTALIAPPISTFEGNLVDLTMNCSAANSSNTIDLVPLDDLNTDATGLKIDEATVLPLGDSIVVDCAQGPTATPIPPTNTAPSNPQMQKLCDGNQTPTNKADDSAQCNLFLTRQGTKIPPLTCAGGLNAATFQERLSIPIPLLPDPKGDDYDGNTIVDDQELGAFEFEIHFDPDKVCVNIIPGTAVTGTLEDPQSGQFICIIEDKDSSQLEGVARIGCVTVGKSFSIDTTTQAGRHLADVVIKPQPDEYSVIKPNQDNGNVIQVNNVACELADLQGHPIKLFSCEDADLTIRFLEGDVEPDCTVNALDTQAIAFRWGVNKGSLIYAAFMNLEPSGTQADNDIDIKDLQFVFGRFGSTCAVPHPDQPPVNPKA
jgi:hypothetical protein